MSDSNSLLKLNVGFIVHQTIGFSRDFSFNIPEVSIEPDLNLTSLIGVVRVTRTPQGLLSQVKMQATIQAECVRCLEIFPQPLEVDFSELYAFNKRSITESGLILPENGNINLRHCCVNICSWKYPSARFVAQTAGDCAQNVELT